MADAVRERRPRRLRARLNIQDLDLDNKRGRITAKRGTVRWVHWQFGTARLLPRLIAGLTHGPLFLALSGHENIRSLAIYVNLSAEAVAAALAYHDPSRRHR